MNKICFCFGHHDASSTLQPQIEAAVERCVDEHGVTEFVVGHYGAFDHMAARAVASVKARRPQVKLILLLPYHPSERPLQIPSHFDGSLYPPNMENVPKQLAIVRANRYMIDQSSHAIVHVTHPGNSRTLLQYAQKRPLQITQIP